jgi:flagellin
MKVADFNKDGIDDFGEGGRIFLATGGGNFASSTYPTNYIGGSSYLDDFNGDGLIDIRAFALGLWEIVYGQSNSLARRSAVNVLSTESAQDLLPLVDGAIETLQNAIAKIGSSINRLDLARDQQSSLAETLSESRERLFAVDFAESTAELVKLQIQQQAQIAVLAQANLQQRSLVQLFQLL